ncbi:hypothetical protein CR513_00290, partial [Mucuna pruriens]
MTGDKRRGIIEPCESLYPLKRLMRKRFVPSPYVRDLHNKLQRLYQGSKSGGVLLRNGRGHYDKIPAWVEYGNLGYGRTIELSHFARASVSARGEEIGRRRKLGVIGVLIREVSPSKVERR